MGSSDMDWIYWLRIGIGARHLWIWQWIVRFHMMFASSWVAIQQAVSKEGLSNKKLYEHQSKINMRYRTRRCLENKFSLTWYHFFLLILKTKTFMRSACLNLVSTSEYLNQYLWNFVRMSWPISAAYFINLSRHFKKTLLEVMQRLSKNTAVTNRTIVESLVLYAVLVVSVSKLIANVFCNVY
jgi:hypothetical protein